MRSTGLFEMSDEEFEAYHERVKRQCQADIARLFRVEPWLVGVGRRPPFLRRVVRRLTGRRYYPWP